MCSGCSAVRYPEARPGYLPQPYCSNGFPITGPCLGADGVPVCCDEDLCGRLYEHNGGKPVPR